MEEKLAKLEYTLFEKPTSKLKNDIKQLKKEVKHWERHANFTGDDGPAIIVKKSDPYTFGSYKPKTGDSIMHTRTIPQPINMWTSTNDQVE